MNIEVKNSIKSVDYNKSIRFLENRVESVLSGKKDELLWIVEHPHIYTAGTNSSKLDLLDQNINVINTKRGGKHTYHGPGQRVVYFVLNLNKRERDIRKLMDNVENCIIKILKEYKIKSHADRNNIGIWVNKDNESKKIAAIGLRVKRWIAYHGFSLNVSCDLSMYKKIVPCGIRNKGITSLEDLGVKKCTDINKIIIKNFLDTFL